MKTKEQVKDKLGISRAKDSLQKKAKKSREFDILIGFLFELQSFILSGFFFGISCFFLRKIFLPLGLIFLGIALYLALDVGEKIQTNAKVNFIVENNINGRLRK